MENLTFMGMAGAGPNMFLALGMLLANEPGAIDRFGGMTSGEKERLISYLRSDAVGDEEKSRIIEALNGLNDPELQF